MRNLEIPLITPVPDGWFIIHASSADLAHGLCFKAAFPEPRLNGQRSCRAPKA